MSGWNLPESAEIGGRSYQIRSDFRAVLDLITVMSDPDLTDGERVSLALEIFYPEFADMPRSDYQDAANWMRWFIAGGDTNARPPKGKLADWRQDFPIIIGPVNRVLGYESRACEHLHWWTFLGAYMEVGDCTFAQVVAIRKKLSRGRKLEKHEREFYYEHRDLVDLKVTETEAEKEILEEWM